MYMLVELSGKLSNQRLKVGKDGQKMIDYSVLRPPSYLFIPEAVDTQLNPQLRKQYTVFTKQMSKPQRAQKNGMPQTIKCEHKIFNVERNQDSKRMVERQHDG